MKHELRAHINFFPLDPRLKILVVLAVLLMVISSRGAIYPAFIAALCVGASFAAGVRWKVLALRFAQPLFLAGLIICMKLFFVGSLPLFSFSIGGMEIAGYKEGLHDGMLIGWRIMGAVSVVAILGFTTSFTDIMAAFAWFRVPRTLIEVSLFTWRYLFLLFDDAMVIHNAQKNRLGYVGYRNGIRSFGTLAGRLVIKAFDNSQSITTAMVQRGYDGRMPVLAHKGILITETAYSTLFVAVMLIVWHVVQFQNL